MFEKLYLQADALRGIVPALQACCTLIAQLDSKSPEGNSVFVELHEVLAFNFWVEDAPSPDATCVYDFLETSHERLRAVSYCLEILRFGISATNEQGSAGIMERVWPGFWRWSFFILTLFRDGWTPILWGTGVDEHTQFIYAVGAVIKALRKSTPKIVLPIIYAFMSLEPSRIFEFEIVPAIHILIREYLTPTYGEGATFDPTS
ncbi:hypothetical protein BDZ89DRAFT_1055195, partial [Hymenopellis radicata]